MIGVLLAAVHLLPLMEFTALSTRQLSVASGDMYPLQDFLHALIFQPSPAGSPWEGLISPGPVVLVLALLGAVIRWRRVWPLVLGIVLVGALAMGNASPLYLAVAHILPDLDLFRGLARIWFVALMLIALLAGFGADALLQRVQRISFRGMRRISNYGTLVAGFAIAFIVAFTLILSDIGYTRAGNVNVVTTPSLLTRTAVQLAGSGRIYGAQENIPQVNAVQSQVPLADGWDPLLIESYVSYMQRAGGYSITGYQLHIPYDSPAVQPRAALLGLMNVSVVVSRRPLTDPRLVQVGRADNTLIYKNTADAGPAYLVQPGPDSNPPLLNQVQRLKTTVHIITLAPEQEAFTFSTSTTAYLVLAVPSFPGWVANLDGRTVPVRLFAGVMPAIRVGLGTHTLSYTYAPTSVRRGAMLSALGLLAALLWLIIARVWQPGKCRLPVKDESSREERPHVSKVCEKVVNQ